ncbi:MAG: HPr family phosphocarrier protein [Planctomycetes bacterium]|nr:HPr family phosphocarrier protein [Planctomycetota bacterium]
MNDAVVSRSVAIVNAQGLHARPACLIVKTANGFDCELTLHLGGGSADCRSIMEMIMLVSPQGAAGRVEARGAGAEAAVEAIASLFADGFGEAYD